MAIATTESDLHGKIEGDKLEIRNFQLKNDRHIEDQYGMSIFRERLLIFNFILEYN